MVARLTLLVVLLLAPLALADHAYSHRVVVAGRVVDAEGVPVPAQDVVVRFTGIEADARCFDAREERTGPQGDFTVCRHAHVLPDGVLVNVTVAGASAEAPLEPALRRIAFHLRLEGGTPARDIEGERLFARTFRVEGRVMQLAPEGAQVENVPVRALPRAGEQVRVDLQAGGRVLAETNVTVTENGDYAIDLAVEDVPEGARARVRHEEAEAWVPASREFRRADLDLVLAEEGVARQDERPGTRTPRVPLPLAVPLGALALAALIAAAARRW